jgi:hypothetical protein
MTGTSRSTLRGTVSKLGVVEPARAHLCGCEERDGKVVTWEIESAGASNLLRAGIRKDDFIGTEVIIKGFLAKDGTPAANASSFTLVKLQQGIT